MGLLWRETLSAFPRLLCCHTCQVRLLNTDRTWTRLGQFPNECAEGQKERELHGQLALPFAGKLSLIILVHLELLLYIRTTWVGLGRPALGKWEVAQKKGLITFFNSGNLGLIRK